MTRIPRGAIAAQVLAGHIVDRFDTRLPQSTRHVDTLNRRPHRESANPRQSLLLRVQRRHPANPHAENGSWHIYRRASAVGGPHAIRVRIEP